jgi:alcohol dehydrogenase class IV
MLVGGLPRVVGNPDDVDAHGDNLVGACLAGVAMAQAGMGVHHRTAHVLGGGWKLSHAETHAVLLPQTTGMVAPHAPEAMLYAARMLGARDPADALFTLLQRLRLPIALSELGMPEDGLDEAARRVWEATHDDPLVPDEAALRHMLHSAYFGIGPSEWASAI